MTSQTKPVFDIVDTPKWDLNKTKKLVECFEGFDLQWEWEERNAFFVIDTEKEKRHQYQVIKEEGGWTVVDSNTCPCYTLENRLGHVLYDYAFITSSHGDLTKDTDVIIMKHPKHKAYTRRVNISQRIITDITRQR